MNNKKLVYGILTTVVVMLMVLFFILSGGRKNQQDSKFSGNPESQPGTASTPHNPLIDQKEIDLIKSDYDNKLLQNNIKPEKELKYEFEYELAPGLKNHGSRGFGQVMAAGACQTANAPSMMKVSTLLAKVDENKAQTMAAIYGIAAKPSGLAADGGAFNYIFTDPATADTLSILSSSGTSNYHVVINGAGSPIAMDQGKQIAQDMLVKYDLVVNSDFKSSAFNDNFFRYFYYRNWGGKPVVDSESIASLENKTPCEAPVAQNINSIEVILNTDGKLAKLINNSRTKTAEKDMPTVSLEKAMAEYGDSAVIPPTVFPKGKVTKGKVLLEESAVVHYDYGILFPQALYTPIYLTRGTVTAADGSKAKVVALFPAVTYKELAKTNVFPEYKPLKDPAVKQATLPKNIAPPPAATPGAGGNKCFGNQIDYYLTCFQDSKEVCRKAFAVRQTGGGKDPLGVCQKGCITQEEALELTGPGTACQTYYDKLKDAFGFDGSMPFSTTKDGSSTGPATCRLKGCPC